jgi:putative transposase
VHHRPGDTVLWTRSRHPDSFFSLRQKNVLDRRSWTTREKLRIAIVTWIEQTYHRRRRQAALGWLTPSNSRPS